MSMNRREFLQGDVALCVVIAIVVGLEAVEIDHEQRKRLAVSL